MGIKRDMPLWNRNFLTTCLSSFFIFTNFYLLTATMPMYVKNDLHGSATHISLIVSLYILGTVILRPFTGLWADKYGKRKIVIIFLTLFIVCNLAYLGTKAIVPLLIVRFINGFGFSAGTTSTAALAMDWIPVKRKGEGVGYYSLFMSLAMVIGPALGLFIANNFAYQSVLIVASIFAFLAMIFSFITKENHHITKETTSLNEFKGISKFIELKALPISLIGFLMAFAYSSLLSYIALYCIELGIPKISMFFFVGLALLIIIPRPLVGKIFDRKGPNYLVYPGLSFFVIGLLLLAFANGSISLLAAGCVIGFGYGAVFPALQTLSISAAPAQRAGTASATFFLLYDIGVGLGSFVFGLLSSSIGFKSMYVVAAIIGLLGITLYFALFRKNIRKKEIVE